MMQPIGIVNSIFNSITYIIPIGNDNDCCLVDCGDVENVIEEGWRVKSVLLTHAHFDHIYGLNKLLNKFPDVSVYTNEAGRMNLQEPKWNFSRYHENTRDFIFLFPERIKVLKDGDKIELSKELSLEVIETPGHEPSCVCFFNDGCIFTGDSHIPGVKVVTSFPRSDKNLAIVSELRIKELSKNRIIYAGHKI